MMMQKLGLIGNCQISAITDGAGGIVWLCLPDPASPSVFASLLDPEAGHFRVRGLSPGTVATDYLANTNVIRTVFKDGDGSFEVIDFCPRFFHKDRIFRPPQIVRIVRPLEGRPVVQIECVPRFDYGATPPLVSLGTHHLNYEAGSRYLRLTSTIPLSYIRNSLPFRLTKPEYFVLSYGEPFEDEIAASAERFLQRTVGYWRSWVKQCWLPRVYPEAVIRSALCLKLHAFEDTGAILAATTTSLPEAPGQGRTWDYRYCWLRDSYFEIDALFSIGHTEEVEKFARYLTNVVASEPKRLHPLYSISGTVPPEESELPHLKGFRGEGPVRVGNAAFHHIQNDVYGELILSLAPILEDPRFTDEFEGEGLFDEIHWLAERTMQFGFEPDTGLWEFRAEPRVHSHSVMTAIAGLRKAARIAAKLKRTDLADVWMKEAQKNEEYLRKVATESPIGIPQAFDGTFDCDAASITALELGIMKGNDPLFLKTLKPIEERLRMEAGLKRYEKDNMGDVEMCFGLCSFWYIDALLASGRHEEAIRWFEKTIGFSNELGLLSEDWTVDGKELWGNFPQVYSHVGLIRSARKIDAFLERSR